MRRLLLAVVITSLIPASSASAQAFEPNDSFNTASGPLTAGTTSSASFETQNDVDYYLGRRLSTRRS